jgi:PTS system mannose-specific IIC component
MSLEHAVMLLAWGTLVGLDLVSMPQAMIARPLVAGAVAGAMLGDLRIGLQLGVIFELFQYDILPMGAVRYPEYGPATVAAVAAAHAVAGALALVETERQLGAIGLGVVVGLVTGLLGGISIHLMRRVNAWAVRRNNDALEHGDVSVLVRLHVMSILRDAARGALVTAVGLALAAGVGDLLVRGLPVRSAMVVAVLVTGAAVAAGTAGTLRLLGRGPDLRWFAAGLLGGIAGAWLR